jgi:hypothetical protein
VDALVTVGANTDFVRDICQLAPADIADVVLLP